MHLDTATSHPVEAFYRSPPNKPCLKIPVATVRRAPLSMRPGPGTQMLAHSVHCTLTDVRALQEHACAHINVHMGIGTRT
jgi:hypothetical protein